MGMLDLIRGKRKAAEEPYTIYTALAGFDKVAEAKRHVLEARIAELAEKEVKAKAELKKIQDEIADTKTFLKHGIKH